MPDTPLSILLVEDSDSDAHLLRAELEQEPAQHVSLHRAQTLAEAADLLRSVTADVILLDLSLPDSTGVDTVVRMSAAAPQLPLVVLTGANDERIGLEAVRHGAQDYLIKGQADARLIARSIRYAIARKKAELALERAQHELEQKVRERTQDLAKTVDDLQAEVRQRLLAEDAVRESQQQLHQVVHNAPVMILGVNTQGVCTIAEGKLEALGLASQLVGRDFRSVLGDHPDVLDHFQRAKAGENVSAEMVLGEVIFDARYSPLRDAAGNVEGVICVATDITERRRMEREVLEATEREQWRIGRDLHDSIQGSLAGIGLMLGALKQRALHQPMGPQAIGAQVDHLSGIVKQTLDQTRALARGLCPVDLKADGLARAFQQLAATTSDLFHVKCQFCCPVRLRLESEALASQLYYIAQEAINNALKHSKARNISISLEPRADRLALTIDDDGVGLPDTAHLARGLGLRTMNYRARLMGAALSVARGEKAGTRVRCEVPGQHTDPVPSTSPLAPATTPSP